MEGSLRVTAQIVCELFIIQFMQPLQNHLNWFDHLRTYVTNVGNLGFGENIKVSARFILIFRTTILNFRANIFSFLSLSRLSRSRRSKFIVLYETGLYTNEISISNGGVVSLSIKFFFFMKRYFVARSDSNRKIDHKLPIVWSY